MTSYAEDFAELYDVFHGNKPYGAEAALLDAAIRLTGEEPHQRLLDVACGTGRHAAAFAQLGWKVVGVDQSTDMLMRARDRAGGLPVEFIAQDMRRLEMLGERFDAATCLFDSIGYAVTNDAIIATLRSIHRNLRPGGVLAIEFWHAPPMLTSRDPVRYREWGLGEGTVVQISETRLDVARQVAEVSYTLHTLLRSGEYRTRREVHTNRYFGVQEIALFLVVAGYDPVQWLAGYDLAAAIDADTWHVIALAVAHEP